MRGKLNNFDQNHVYRVQIYFIYFQQISEIDTMPNYVCETCWQITEAFHDLYQKSKISHETLLNIPIKIEPDINEPWPGTNVNNYMEVSLTEIGPIKDEPNLGT